jgi:hypothetical protein
MFGIILASYVIVAALSIMRIRRGIASSHESIKNAEKKSLTKQPPSPGMTRVLSAAFHIRSRISCTVVIVFISFVLRMLMSLVVAFSFEVDNFGGPDDLRQCDHICLCGTAAQKLGYWFTSFPEIRLCVMLVSSPMVASQSLAPACVLS